MLEALQEIAPPDSVAIHITADDLRSGFTAWLETTSTSTSTSPSRTFTTNRLRQILGPWKRPDLRMWPAYYDSSFIMLHQMVSQQATALHGTASTS
jgi:hypothetical protein